ncbi:hypothetical protein [Sinosporangium siamense]|uniref:hypothetical protein n=1 Tax=Sinosporangium siamense TaxID=1367973 RepID=UPI00194FE746|nr:hypothetical protein [Sinosporangium siamense]
MPNERSWPAATGESVAEPSWSDAAAKVDGDDPLWKAQQRPGAGGPRDSPVSVPITGTAFPPGVILPIPPDTVLPGDTPPQGSQGEEEAHPQVIQGHVVRDEPTVEAGRPPGPFPDGDVLGPESTTVPTAMPPGNGPPKPADAAPPQPDSPPVPEPAQEDEATGTMPRRKPRRHSMPDNTPIVPEPRPRPSPESGQPPAEGDTSGKPLAPPDWNPQAQTPAVRGPFTPPGTTDPAAPEQTANPVESGKGRAALFAVAGVLLIVGLATGGYFAFRALSPDGPGTALHDQPEDMSPPDEAPVLPEPDDLSTTLLDAESTDPRKMTVAEVFPSKKLEIGESTFVRIKTDLTNKCGKAAAGPFAKELSRQQCSRVLRATYVDKKQKYAVTTGIAVLPTHEAATAVNDLRNFKNNLWFRALPGKNGSGADRVHIAGGYASGYVWGRYIVFSYATHSDGRTPTDNDKPLGKISSAFRDTTASALERRITN